MSFAIQVRDHAWAAAALTAYEAELSLILQPPTMPQLLRPSPIGIFRLRIQPVDATH